MSLQAEVPLVVDLDGTLLRTDLLFESLCGLVAGSPLSVVRVPGWIYQGKAHVKAMLADRVALAVETLPLTEELIAYIRAERGKGRKVFIASASDRRLVEAIASHLGLFDGVLGSDGTTNLKGAAKAERLVSMFGERGFDYAGDTDADLHVWKRARRAILVNCSTAITSKVNSTHGDVISLAPRRVRVGPYLQALRLQRWPKNLLLVIPALVAAAPLTTATILTLVIAVLAFGSMASAGYVINDMVDLASDRRQERRRLRPLASGAVPLVHAMALALGLGVGAMILAATISAGFLGLSLLFLVTSVAYSVYLKRRPLSRVLGLVALNMLRVVAGTSALPLALSPTTWGCALGLSVGLALVQRMARG